MVIEECTPVRFVIWAVDGGFEELFLVRYCAWKKKQTNEMGKKTKTVISTLSFLTGVAWW